MLNWLKSWFTPKTPTPTNPPNLWRPKERLIFSFFDGKENRSVDPMPLYRKVRDIEKEVAADLVLARSQMKDALKGWSLAAGRIRKAFGLDEYSDQGGLTELECVELFDAFKAWVGVEKKSTPSPSTTSAETSTPTPPSSNGNKTETSPTPNGSAGGSTDVVGPSPTPTAPVSGSE